MDYRVSKIFLYLIVTASALSALPVCAQSQNSPPSTAISAADEALATASAAKADSLAPEEYRRAEAVLQEANALLVKRKSKDAERMALRARLYADLATAKAHYIQVRETVEERTSANAALRRELFLGRDGQPL